MKTYPFVEWLRKLLIVSEILFDGYLIGVHWHPEFQTHPALGLGLFSRKPAQDELGFITL
jgi:hypothetical protein